MSPPTSEVWRALAREAASAAEHICIGTTAIGRANHAQNAYYSQALFALSVGLERSCKLALSVNDALEGKGFADRSRLRSYGHDLKALLKDVDALADRRGFGDSCTLPQDPVHRAILDVLCAFANNLTRYYNLEFAAGDSAAAAEDPISAWFNRVTLLVLTERDTARTRARRHARAAMLRDADALTLVRHQAEDGSAITSLEAGVLHAGIVELARPWERLHILQIARFLAEVFSGLSSDPRSGPDRNMPYFPEFFAIFRNSDSYFRRRRTWSIYI